MDQGESSSQHHHQQQKQQLQPHPPPPSLPSASASSSVSSPCAACKLLRRRCARDCVFAPFFPPDEPHKFVCVHRIFGASNVSKMLQDVNRETFAKAVYRNNIRLVCAVELSGSTQIRRLQNNVHVVEIDRIYGKESQAPKENERLMLSYHHIMIVSKCGKRLGNLQATAVDGELPFDRRADAVSSLVYEAHARIRDPVYGSAGTISFLKAQVEILQKQVLWLQAELIALRLRISQLMEPSAMASTQTQTQTQAAEDHPPPSPPLPPPPSSSARSLPFYSDDNHSPWN